MTKMMKTKETLRMMNEEDNESGRNDFEPLSLHGEAREVLFMRL